MAEHTITLTLPDDLYHVAQSIAKDAETTVEDALVQRLYVLLDSRLLRFASVEGYNELKALEHLTDAALRTLVREQMPNAKQARMQVLMKGINYGTLTPEETAEHRVIFDEGQQLMLRKAYAADVLMKRGHALTEQDWIPEPLFEPWAYDDEE